MEPNGQRKTGERLWSSLLVTEPTRAGKSLGQGDDRDNLGAAIRLYFPATE